MTNPVQSKPAGDEPPHRYALPTYCWARSATCDPGSGAAAATVAPESATKHTAHTARRRTCWATADSTRQGLLGSVQGERKPNPWKRKIWTGRQARGECQARKG